MVSHTTRGGSTRTADDEGGRDGGQVETLSKDTAFHLLQNGRRRAVLRYLLDDPEGDVVRMSDVAETVAAWDHEKPVEQLRSAERQRVYIALYQSHLPKLADQGIIDYDQRRGTIALRPLAYALVPLLEDDFLATQTLHVDEATPEDERRGGLLSKLGL